VYRSRDPPPDVGAAAYRVRPALICFSSEAEAREVFEALHCFYREVGRGAQVKELLPCWEVDPDQPGRSRRAPVAKQKAAFHMQHVAACGLSACNQQAYRTLSPDPALSLQSTSGNCTGESKQQSFNT
jgi:hypothetical protein